ncbi:hypothetical protein F4802DRAFT_613960 [Xylaria palmicola]|nr:hypothetical protein F4802DRAFT_613960 [Xylaria palmicola]
MTLPQVPGLQKLPYELIAYIVDDLDIEDVFHWSLCNKHFQFIIREERFCKSVITKKAPSSLEAREALETGGFSRALRRVAKRHLALSRASPFAVGIVACADSYGFFGGKLCYVIEARPNRWLRILDLHRSADRELVIDIPALIRTAVPRAVKSRKYKFKVLYQAAGIVSCLLSFALPQTDTENWLLILNPQSHQILEVHRLESAAKIFVRNDNKYLYYGTHSWEGPDGFRKWVIKGFDLKSLSWFSAPRLYLSDLAGNDIGSTVCFEIFGDYFYGLSNQTLFEADDPEWESHYYCFRFPLKEPSRDNLQLMNKEDSWRRKHAEGPIDDRWGFLSLELDQANGNIVILECRKEWLGGRSGSQRTYYTTEVLFREQAPSDQLRVRNGTTRRLGDHPQSHAPIPARRAEYVHAGDNSSTESLLVRSKTHFCGYIRSCYTFIDLIDDPGTGMSGLQRLRLRTGQRVMKPTTQPASWGLPLDAPRAISEPSLLPYQASNAIFMWPPEQDLPGLKPSLDKVQQILNIEGHQGCVTATGDERSIVFATSESPKGGVKAIVCVSFDPATRFAEMEYGGHLLGQRSTQEAGDGTDTCSDGGPSGRKMLHFSPEGAMGVATDMTRRNTADRSSSGPPSLDAAAGSSDGRPPGALPDAPEGIKPWVCYERAMHLEIQRKLFFGC